jgi:hypothetical protein
MSTCRALLFVALGAAAGLAAADAMAARPLAEAPAAPAGRVLHAVGLPECACEVDRVELERYRDLVAAAPDSERGRALAERPSRLARRALGAARRLVPWSRELRSAHARLVDYEARVARAATPADAAREFEGLVRLAGDMHVDTTTCNYTTTEIIAIILGFLLFIIPGIILLILFC